MYKKEIHICIIVLPINIIKNLSLFPHAFGRPNGPKRKVTKMLPLKMYEYWRKRMGTRMTDKVVIINQVMKRLKSPTATIILILFLISISFMCAT